MMAHGTNKGGRMTTKHAPATPAWKIAYVPGSANEFRIWDKHDNFLFDTSEDGGADLANKINALSEDRRKLVEALRNWDRATTNDLKRGAFQDGQRLLRSLGEE